MSELDVIVVGAGAAGLAAARQLATARLSVRVLGPIGFDRSKKIRRNSLGDFRYFAWAHGTFAVSRDCPVAVCWHQRVGLFCWGPRSHHQSPHSGQR